MLKLSSLSEMRAWSRAQRAHGGRVGFVPTRGSVPEGHLRLAARAKALPGRLVLSVFVNPLQCGPQEAFATSPRDLARARARAGGRGHARDPAGRWRSLP